MKAVIGVDPGFGGAISAVDLQGNLLFSADMPVKAAERAIDPQGIIALVKPYEVVHAYVEVVQSRPRQAGQFVFGLNTGVIHGTIQTLGIPMTLVTSAKWKSQYGIKRHEGESYAEKKDEARGIAASLFPAAKQLFARKKDDGRSEAALIALYGLSLYINN